MMLRSAIGIGISLCAVGVAAAACGGGDGSGAGAKSIASMPPYPNPSAKNAEPATDPSKPKDAKQICADANDVKMADASGAGSKRVFRTSLDDKDKDNARAPVVASNSGSKSKDIQYSIADLQALEKKSAWEELLGHAEDIAPAQRDAVWEKLIEHAAIGNIKQLTADDASFEGVFTSQSLTKRYPHLTKSADFMTKRGEAGKAASEICLRDSYRGQHCLEMMKDFLKTPNTASDIGFAFGKITRKNQFPYVAIPFFKWAFDQKKEAKDNNTLAMCTDDDLQRSVVAALGLPTDEENARGGRQLAAYSCWDSLKVTIKKELTATSTGFYRDNACAVLKAKGDL